VRIVTVKQAEDPSRINQRILLKELEKSGVKQEHAYRELTKSRWKFETKGFWTTWIGVWLVIPPPSPGCCIVSEEIRNFRLQTLLPGCL
jgi:hypothetical protein